MQFLLTAYNLLCSCLSMVQDFLICCSCRDLHTEVHSQIHKHKSSFTYVTFLSMFFYCRRCSSDAPADRRQECTCVWESKMEPYDRIFWQVGPSNLLHCLRKFFLQSFLIFALWLVEVAKTFWLTPPEDFLPTALCGVMRADWKSALKATHTHPPLSGHG